MEFPKVYEDSSQLYINSKFLFVINIESILGSECIKEKHLRLIQRSIRQTNTNGRILRCNNSHDMPQMQYEESR